MLNQTLNMQMLIAGAVPSKFTMSDYSEDCVNVSALVSLDTDQGGVGQGAEVFKYKTSEAINEFKNLDFTNPIPADCKVKMVKKGKKVVMQLLEVTFKQQPKKA